MTEGGGNDDKQRPQPRKIGNEKVEKKYGNRGAPSETRKGAPKPPPRKSPKDK